MKKIIFSLFLICCITQVAYAQKKEKIKGSRNVVVKQHDLPVFNAIDIGEEFEVALVKGDIPKIEIEADDNLHDVIDYTVNDGTLYLTTSHKIISSKTFKIRLTFTSELNTIIAKEKAEISSLIDLEFDDITITAKENSKVYITLRGKSVKIITLKKAKTEFNITANNTVVEMSDSSDMKALINSNNLVFDLYQKANAKIEGDIDELKVRADNATNFNGQKLTAVNAELIAEGSSDCLIEVKKELTLEASGNTEVQVFNNPKINLKKFTDSASLYKK